MGPHGSENFKTLLLQIAVKSFETSSQFSSQWSSQNYVWDFWNLEFLIFNAFFRKYQIHHCSLWRNQKPQLSGKGAIMERNGVVKFGSQGLVFSVIRVLLTVKCLRSFWVIWCISDFRQPCISKMAGRMAKWSEIWALGICIQCRHDTFDS